MKTSQRLRQYLVERGLQDEPFSLQDWIDDPWLRIHVRGRRIPVFPAWGMRAALTLHDIHHDLTRYDTSWRGELEIAAWELGSGGCGWNLLFWVDRITILLLGVWFAPQRVWRAFGRGLRQRNLFRRRRREVLETEFRDVRRFVLGS